MYLDPPEPDLNGHEKQDPDLKKAGQTHDTGSRASTWAWYFEQIIIMWGFTTSGQETLRTRALLAEGLHPDKIALGDLRSRPGKPSKK